jgi:hypothetical protein
MKRLLIAALVGIFSLQAVAETNTNLVVVARYVAVGTNGVIKSPANFLEANDIARASDVSPTNMLYRDSSSNELYGSLTALAYYGDGSHLTGISSTGRVSLNEIITNSLKIGTSSILGPGGYRSFYLEFITDPMNDNGISTNRLFSIDNDLYFQPHGDTLKYEVLHGGNLSIVFASMLSINAFNSWATNSVKIVNAPTSNTQHGSVGQIAADTSNLYVYVKDGGGVMTNWIRIPGSFKWP